MLVFGHSYTSSHTSPFTGQIHHLLLEAHSTTFFNTFCSLKTIFAFSVSKIDEKGQDRIIDCRI